MFDYARPSGSPRIVEDRYGNRQCFVSIIQWARSDRRDVVALYSSVRYRIVRMNRGHVTREDDGVAVAGVQEIFTYRGCSVSGGFHVWMIFTFWRCLYTRNVRIQVPFTFGRYYIDPGSCSGDIRWNVQCACGADLTGGPTVQLHGLG